MNKTRVTRERLGICIEMLFTDRPFEDRIRAAAALGFSNVEMWFIDSTYTGTPEALGELLDFEGIRMTNTVIGSPDGTIGGGLAEPGNIEGWLERTRKTLEFNRRAGIPATIVCTGNAMAGVSHGRVRDAVRDGLLRTAELAEKFAIDLFIEPLNTIVDHPGYFLTSSDEAAGLCREIGSDRLKILYDCYHMQIMEGNLSDHIARNLDVIGHVHIAGVPGRHEPENGEVDYRFLLSRVMELGYEGVIGFEYLPVTEHERSLSDTAKYLTGGNVGVGSVGNRPPRDATKEVS